MSVDFQSKEPFEAQYERSDTCIVPAAGVVGEAMVTIVLAQAVQEKFGGDSLQEIKTNLENYSAALREM
jgi:chorismate synthase